MAVIWAVTGAGPRRRTARPQHWLFPGKLTCPSRGMRLRKPVRRRRPTQPYFQAHHTQLVSASVRCPRCETLSEFHSQLVACLPPNASILQASRSTEQRSEVAKLFGPSTQTGGDYITAGVAKSD